MSTPPRTHTPDRINDDGTTTIHLKRACNGCDGLIGDLTKAELEACEGGKPLPDVRAECEHCRPLVELEAAGCRTWQLTRRNIALIDDEVDRDGIYAKGYFEWDGGASKTVCVGLRIGRDENRIVARFGDWIVRHPGGTFTVHKAPAPPA